MNEDGSFTIGKVGKKGGQLNFKTGKWEELN